MKVLVATEGSEFSEAAIRKFCRIFGASDDLVVRVVSVVEPTFVPAEPFAVSAEYVRELDQAAHKAAADAVDRAAALINERCPAVDDVKPEVLTGVPEKVIIEEAENWGADLIVTGSHGRGFWKRAWLGSVSNAIVHHAPCSVLVVRRED